MKKAIALLSILLMFSFVSQADAMIVSGKFFEKGKKFIKLDGDDLHSFFVDPTGATDNRVGKNNFDVNNRLFGFDEKQDVLVTEELLSDIWPRLPLASIPAGVIVDSHYIFFDPKKSRTARGYVIFDNPIYAIMTSRDNLKNSDFLLGRDDVKYKNPSLRGLEVGDDWDDKDWVKVGRINPNRLNLSWRASSPGDYVRVLTYQTVVPEPASMFLLGSGLLGFAGLRRKGRK